ncbi:hypothetical protein ABZ883_22225 [Streptomyces sp. NPDC046977]
MIDMLALGAVETIAIGADGVGEIGTPRQRGRHVVVRRRRVRARR